MATIRRRKRKQESDPNELFLFTQEEMSGEWRDTKQNTVDTASPSCMSVVQTVEATDTQLDMEYMTDNMLWALKQMDSIDDIRQIRLIAMEVGSIASARVNLNTIYKLQTMPYQTLDGYQFVSLYYASFHFAFPSMLNGIKLPYEHAFGEALSKFEEWKIQRP